MMFKRYLKNSISITTFIFISLGFLPSKANAESDDIDKFRRINRSILFHRTQAEIGNYHSIRDLSMNIQVPQLSGNGCTDEKTSVVLSNDKRAISIMFDNYSLPIGGIGGVRRMSKNCLIRLPVSIPAGHKLTVVGLDFRGFVLLPTSANASLMAMHRFYRSGDGHPLSRRFIRHDEFVGAIEQEYILTASLKNKVQWSECGRSMILEIQTQIKAQTNSQFDEVLMTLDSLDGQASDDLTYHLLWQRC